MSPIDKLKTGSVVFTKKVKLRGNSGDWLGYGCKAGTEFMCVLLSIPKLSNGIPQPPAIRRMMHRMGWVSFDELDLFFTEKQVSDFDKFMFERMEKEEKEEAADLEKKEKIKEASKKVRKTHKKTFEKLAAT